MLIGQTVRVIGAGVAGLASARALAMRGAKVRVAERAPALGLTGGGLQIAPNGMAVLDALGLGPEIRRIGQRAEAIELCCGFTGRRLLRLDLARDAPDLEYRLVHRSDLIAMLAEAAGAAGAEIVLGHEAADEGGLTVAADGLRSAIRARLNPGPEAAFSGQVAWRAVVPGDGGPPVTRAYLAPGCHLVSYPLRGGAERNVVAVMEKADWAADDWSMADDPDRLRQAFAFMPDPVQAILARVTQVHLWGLFLHPVAPVWTDGRVVLAGDAAHPTLPFLAQGANIALEDAWVLAARLAERPAAEALAAYHAQRRPRVERAIAAAWANARNYHLAGPARWAAHKALRLADLVAPSRMLARFDWLYRHDLTRDPG